MALAGFWEKQSQKAKNYIGLGFVYRNYGIRERRIIFQMCHLGKVIRFKASENLKTFWRYCAGGYITAKKSVWRSV